MKDVVDKRKKERSELERSVAGELDMKQNVNHELHARRASPALCRCTRKIWLTCGDVLL